MSQIDLEYRPGKPEDVEQAIPLIYSSGPPEFDYVLARGQTTSFDYLRTAFVARKSNMGCQHYTVAEAKGRVVGIGACYNGAEFKRMELHSVWPVIRCYGLRNSIEVIRRSRQIDEFSPPPDNDTGYLMHLGVAEDLRGRGIATALMKRLIAGARRKNRRICALD
jgi:ribosomal protein S18 acetylase RimI-like enzyme